uniref:CN hydrolase domain-containing protein n=1 Tax=Strigamia maritima TaxID=126957 RepID=T1ITK1_STRMM
MYNICSLIIFSLILSSSDAVNSHTFRAAVVDYEPIKTDKVTLESTLENAYVLAKYALEARWEDVDLLVFPEYGLTGMVQPDRNNATNTFAQDIPDPTLISWNPCDEPDLFPNTKVLQVVSCAAKYNAMVIAANLIGREPCNNTDADCPSDGQYFYNTNVMFYKNGTFAAKYHKKHLFMEPYINPSNKLDYTIIDIGFTKVACVICYDIVHREPIITLIKEKGVKNIIFSTAWINILPFITAPQLYTSIARGLGINLIAANHFAPNMSMMGSGIFTSGKGALNQTFDLSSPGKMIIADVPLNPEKINSGDLKCDDDSHYDHSEEFGAVHPPLMLVDPFTKTPYPSSQVTSKLNTFVNIRLTEFSFFYFDQNRMENHVDLCKGDFCCHLDYAFSNKDDTVYAFAVNDGVMQVEGDPYEVQVCAVMRCEREDASTCGQVPLVETKTTFKELSIEGTFDNNFVLPQMFGTDLQLIHGKDWNFKSVNCYDHDGSDITTGKVALTGPTEQPIMVASLLGLFD